MSMLQVHLDALESTNVPYNDFLLYFRSAGKRVFGFVEGKDDPSFYQNFVESVLEDGWECKLIPAGNREKVLALLRQMDWNRFPRGRVGFFVDRDLSLFIDGPFDTASNLFVTDGYSIENDVVCEYTLMRTITEVCCVDGLQPHEVDGLVAAFRRNFEAFGDGLARPMAQIIVWRKANAAANSVKGRLDRFKVGEMFGFVNGTFEWKPACDSAEKRLQLLADAVGDPLAGPEEIRVAEDDFRRQAGVSRFIRGKYLMVFFVACIEHLRVAIPSLFGRHVDAPGKNAGIGAGNAIRTLGPRARCPPSLRTFLNDNYVAYVRQNAPA